MNFRRTLTTCKLIACWLILLAVAAGAQLRPIMAAKPFGWSVSSQKTTGDSVRVIAKLSIAQGHYVYQDKTRIEPVSQDGVIFGSPVFSPHIKKKDKFTGKDELVYVDTLTISVPVRARESVTEVQLAVYYQGCSESMCFLPATDTLRAALPKTAITQAPKPSGTAGTGTISLLAAFLGGLLTSLTPCVYPLIPITLAIFGASSAKGRLQAFSVSLTFVLGLAATFSVLGIVAVKTGSVFGRALSHPWVIAGISAIFVAFALSMFGLFDIQLPARLQEKLASTGGKGYRKSFVMGAVSGLIAAPCTGPALGAILAYVAVASTPLLGWAMLVFYALGLGLPFLLLGTFSSLAAARPKPGPWMEGIKSVLGIALVITALYLARSVLPQQLWQLNQWPVLMGLLAFAGVVLGAIHISLHGASPLLAFRKVLGILLVVSGVFGLLHGRLWEAPLSPEMPGQIQWTQDVEQELARARAESKPVMIDYYAAWCAACNELDRKTFPDPDVAQELKRFVVIRADMTKSSPQSSEWARRESVAGLPTIDFYDSKGERLLQKRVLGFMDPDSFAALLKDIQ